MHSIWPVCLSLMTQCLSSCEYSTFIWSLFLSLGIFSDISPSFSFGSSGL